MNGWMNLTAETPGNTTGNTAVELWAAAATGGSTKPIWRVQTCRECDFLHSSVCDWQWSVWRETDTTRPGMRPETSRRFRVHLPATPLDLQTVRPAHGWSFKSSIETHSRDQVWTTVGNGPFLLGFFVQVHSGEVLRIVTFQRVFRRRHSCKDERYSRRCLVLKRQESVERQDNDLQTLNVCFHNIPTDTSQFPVTTT